ncbi:MAG: glycoside hydrolase family protein [Rikenellaceae bacterium]
MKRTIIALALLCCIQTYAQDIERPRPAEWEGIVEGGRFQDRFLPMVGSEIRSDVWGAKEVIPRYVDNGIEDDIFSYWGGNIIEEGGKYHQFLCGWMENSPKGHMTWSRSIIMRAESDNLSGPFKVMDIVGFGHNPDIFRTRSGGYMIATMINWKPYYYTSKSLLGPWKLHDFKFDARDRKVIEGMSNLSFTRREDGSVLMVCRGGGIWISRDGDSLFMQVTDGSVYPKREGKFEDPEIWRDNVQYNLIVNDWLGRVAYYMRSKDGVHWVEDAGEAYTPGIAYHKDGHVEKWYKFERIKIFQDPQRRAVQANFAVCDTLKKADLGNDNHSSKNIAIPINKGLLMEIVESKIEPRMKTLSVRVKAESGFYPIKDLNIATLRFGLSKDVNFGKGCRVKSTRSEGDDLILVFDTRQYSIPDSEFAPKLLGRNTSGEVVFGYARNPNVDFAPALVSTRRPIYDPQQKVLNVEIQNFGLSASDQLEVRIYGDNGALLTNGIAQPLKPYEKRTLQMSGIDIEKESYEVVVYENGKELTRTHFFAVSRAHRGEVRP